MVGLNFIDLLDRAQRLSGPHLALVDDHQRFTHAELGAITSQLAQALLARGFTPSTPYAVLSPNTALAMVALIGGLRAGGAWSNINLRSGVNTNTDVLRRGGCRALFFHSSAAALVPAMVEAVATLEHVVCLDQALQGYPSLAQFSAGQPEHAVNTRLEAGAVGFQGSTGGTTGAPKITQAAADFLAWNCLGFMHALNAFSADDPPVNLAVAPITHAGGIVALATLAMGGQVVLMAVPDLAGVLAKVAQHKVSLLFLPPTLIYMLMNQPQCSGTDFSSLRYLMAAAAPFASEKIAQAHALFGPVICQSFGQTESGFPLTFMAPAAVSAALRDPALAARLRSVGQPTVNVSAIEIMSEAGALLGPGEVGEIVLRGPTVMLRYLNDPAATAALQHQGWQHTGDLGYRDADGYLYISDRKRDLIISGGFNVFPLEVEQVLARHPGVQDCAVIGVPDAKWGEAVKAVVELAPGHSVSAEELIALCKQALGSVMAPKSIDFIAQLPRSAVGKVLKRELRASYWQGQKDAI